MIGDRQVYYFGCCGDLGHYLWSTTGRTSWREECTPWPLRELDGELAGVGVQDEGRVKLHHRNGWTAIAFWDRSGDSRGNSNSAFIARGELSGEEMLALFEASFPVIWQRITAKFPLVLAEAA